MDLTEFLVTELSTRGKVIVTGTLGDAGTKLEVTWVNKKGREAVSNFANFTEQLQDLYDQALQDDRWQAKYGK